MLLNEFFTPSNNDLKLLALIVLSNGQLTFNTVKGDQNLIASIDRLSNLDLVVVVNDTIVLTQSGKSVTSINGIADSTGKPTKNAINITNREH